jgi:hypothetical protein
VYDVGAAEDDGRGGEEHAERAAQAIRNAAFNAYEMHTSARGIPVGRDAPNFFARAFPWLFFDGKGDYAREGLDHTGGMTFRQWAKYIFRSAQDRCKCGGHFWPYFTRPKARPPTPHPCRSPQVPLLRCHSQQPHHSRPGTLGRGQCPLCRAPGHHFSASARSRGGRSCTAWRCC